MFFNSRRLLPLFAVLSLAASACSASQARPAQASLVAVECVGGTIQSEEDAARYHGCTAVTGDLRIVGSDLRNLKSLSSLRSVAGTLQIANNAQLVSLKALNGLRRAGAVEIRDNRVLCGKLGLLAGLGEVEHSLEVSANRTLSKGEIANLREQVKRQLDQSTPALQQEASLR